MSYDDPCGPKTPVKFRLTFLGRSMWYFDLSPRLKWGHLSYALQRSQFEIDLVLFASHKTGEICLICISGFLKAENEFIWSVVSTANHGISG
jgi:hypothetical protein